jgi:hypothetical protein
VTRTKSWFGGRERPFGGLGDRRDACNLGRVAVERSRQRIEFLGPVQFRLGDERGSDWGELLDHRLVVLIGHRTDH